MNTKKGKALTDGLKSINRGGFQGLISGSGSTSTAPTNQERTKSEQRANKERTPSDEVKTPSTYGRMCAVVNIELQRKMQEIAHREALTFKEVLEQAMSKAIAAYEKKNGAIQLTDRKGSKELF